MNSQNQSVQNSNSQIQSVESSSSQNQSGQSSNSTDLSMYDLPQEILIQFFQNLSQVDLLKKAALVSKFLYNLTKDRSLPISVDIKIPFYLDSPGNEGVPKDPHSLAVRGRQISDLTLTSLPPRHLKVNDSDSNMRLYYFCIMHQIAQTITIPQGYLSQVFKTGSVLKKLVIRIKEPLCLNRSNEMEQVDDFFKKPTCFAIPIQDLAGIGNCKSMEHLDVYLLNINLETFKEIVSLPKLTVLHIRLSAEVTPEQFLQVMYKARLFKLKELFIHFVAVTDQCLVAIAEMLPNLERLRVQSQQVSGIGLEGVRAVAERCYKIQKLSIFKLDLGGYDYVRPIVNAWKKDEIIKEKMDIHCGILFSFAEFTRKQQ